MKIAEIREIATNELAERIDRLGEKVYVLLLYTHVFRL